LIVNQSVFTVVIWHKATTLCR